MSWVVPLLRKKYPQSVNYFTIYHLFPMIYLILTINFFSFILLFMSFCFVNHRNSFSHLLIILLLRILLRIRPMILLRMILLILVLEHLLFSDQVFLLFFQVLLLQKFLKIPVFSLIICFLGFTLIQQVSFGIFFLMVFLLFFRLN
jgi:hypothetical protein